MANTSSESDWVADDTRRNDKGREGDSRNEETLTKKHFFFITS